MTDEKIMVQIVASANGAHVDSTQGGVRKTIGRYECGDGITINRTRCTDETRSAITSALVNAAVEAHRLEKHLNTPPEPPAPTLREAAEKARRLMESEDGVDARVWNAAIAQLQQALEAEGGDE